MTMFLWWENLGQFIYVCSGLLLTITENKLEKPKKFISGASNILEIMNTNISQISGMSFGKTNISGNFHHIKDFKDENDANKCKFLFLVFENKSKNKNDLNSSSTSSFKNNNLNMSNLSYLINNLTKKADFKEQEENQDKTEKEAKIELDKEKEKEIQHTEENSPNLNTNYKNPFFSDINYNYQLNCKNININNINNINIFKPNINNINPLINQQTNLKIINNNYKNLFNPNPFILKDNFDDKRRPNQQKYNSIEKQPNIINQLLNDNKEKEIGEKILNQYNSEIIDLSKENRRKANRQDSVLIAGGGTGGDDFSKPGAGTCVINSHLARRKKHIN